MGSLEGPVAEVVTIDVHATKSLFDSGYRYLDVRTEEEFKDGYPEAKDILNIPYLFNTPEGRVPNPRFMEQVSSLYSKEELIVVGCRSGVRSLAAGAELLKFGYKHVSNMGGGYLGWVEKGLPTTKPSEQEKALPVTELVEKEEVWPRKSPLEQEEQQQQQEVVA